MPIFEYKNLPPCQSPFEELRTQSSFAAGMQPQSTPDTLMRMVRGARQAAAGAHCCGWVQGCSHNTQSTRTICLQKANRACPYVPQQISPLPCYTWDLRWPKRQQTWFLCPAHGRKTWPTIWANWKDALCLKWGGNHSTAAQNFSLD